MVLHSEWEYCFQITQRIVVKGDNVPNFSKMNGGRTGNGTAHGTSHGMQSDISYVNSGNGTGSGTLDCMDHMSNVFQILNDIQKG